MDSKEVKALLKAAREAIRQKEFKEALKNCKLVLKADKDNYNALVFAGVASEGLEQPEHALKAFGRASEISPEQILAWQGLCSVYEKSPREEFKVALVAVYEKLLKLYEREKEKWLETVLKLAELQVSLGNVDKAVGSYHAALLETSEKSAQSVIWRKLITLLETKTSLSDDLENMLVEAYKTVLSSEGQGEEVTPMIKSYLQLLEKREDVEEIKSESERIVSLFPDVVYPLELLIQLKLDALIVNCERPKDTVTELRNKLKSVDSENNLLKLVDGFVTMCNKDFPSAKLELETGVRMCRSSVCGWVYLAEVLSSLSDHKGSLTACEKAVRTISDPEKKLFSPQKDVEHHIKVLTAKGYLYQGGRENLEKAAALLEELLGLKCVRQDHVSLLATVYIKQEKTDLAQSLLEDHRDVLTNSAELLAVHGQIAFAKKELEKAVELFESAIKVDDEQSRYHLLLGCVQWEIADRSDKSDAKAAQKAFNHWLKSAKLNPYDGEVFRCLGDFYGRVQNDIVKAKRCYQKSFSLNQQDEVTGQALCDSLTATGEEEMLHSVLLTVTSKAHAGRAKWAWLRLGLYQMKNSDPTSAVSSFQAALRADPGDNHAWECLAEAYLNRGSFTAALKAFTKALELDESSLYCLYQIAFIKQTLGQFTEAVEEYKAVLGKSSNYVPALKGVGETLILLARKHLKQSFNLRAKENCSEAIRHLTQGASLRPDLSCLWKLLGDSCTLLHPLAKENFRCYGQALKLLPDCAALWHDLGTNYFCQSQHLSGEAAVVMVTKSVQVLQKAVTIGHGDFGHWNALGRVACHPAVNKLDLAQHCFIKSIQTERSNVVAWTNLGTLYLKNDNIKLAHDAFTIAQSLDPTYVACWIGQAMIAETVGHEDAMDLFRHTTELGHHLESALSYGHWVCSAMRNLDRRNSEMYQYCIEQMAAVPMASDALSKYLDRVKTNPTAYNIYGILLEKQGLLQSACQAFKSAVDVLTADSEASPNLIIQARCNYARVLCNSCQYEEAIREYQSLGADLRFEEMCGLAFALYKQGQLAQSFQVYEKALEYSKTDEDRSHVYAAIGMVAYKFGDMDGVKTALFKCSQTLPSSSQGVAALCSFGFLQSDVTLVSAALEELMTRNSVDLLRSTTLLSVALHVLQDEVLSPLAVMNTVVTEHPDNMSLWELKSSLLLHLDPGSGQETIHSAMVCLSHNGSSRKTALLNLSLGLLARGDNHCEVVKDVPKSSTLRTAQKALHLCPDGTDSMVAVICALHAEAVLTKDNKKQRDFLESEMKFIRFLLQGRDSLTPSLRTWLVEIQIVGLMMLRRFVEAKQIIGETQVDDSPHLSILLHLIGALSGDGNTMTNTPSDLNASTFLWQMFAGSSISQGDLHEADGFYRQCLQQADSSSTTHKQTQFIPLVRLGHLAYLQLRNPEADSKHWQTVFDEAVAEVLKIDKSCSAVLLMQALLCIQDNPRLSKHHLQQILENRKNNLCGEYVLSLARKLVIRILKETKKDQQAVQDLLKDGEENGDQDTLDWYKTTYEDKMDRTNKADDVDYWDKI